MKHVMVQNDPEKFYGWPANCGIWSWGDEIVVGFTEATYLEKTDKHSIDDTASYRGVTARSLNGGETWALERPDNFPEGFVFGTADPDGPCNTVLENPIDFTDPDVALRIKNDRFRVSRDRCRTWDGPYALPFSESSVALTSRTDYLPFGVDSCMFFVSVKDRQVQGGPFTDRAFCTRTDDGGRTFRRMAFLLPENPDVRSVMPSTVRIDADTLVSAVRRRKDETTSECWLDAAVSTNLGETWGFLSRIADTQSPGHEHNGNPPSLVALGNGRLCVVYGYRAPSFGIRAKISSDCGNTWGEEILLRDDGRTWDIGYPRSVVRTDGKLVSIYYFTTEANRSQHIAATIWDPSEA